ncbi:Clp protease N-terminal domain-containing protein [Actinomycetospora sp. OC33-EN08]|uniref:Clp protease N-terminal domain-containing protein n=1 Tax=Actinomycetospora aurantiaca TaxID=3129233 RepID=A0ABU8MJF4_9PSEU
MFERFTEAARRVVVLAQEEARQRRADRVAPEHLLLGLLRCPGTPGAELLRAAGVGTEEVERGLASPGPHDAAALAALGIDLDAVRRAAERAFGPGALDRPRGQWRAGHIRFDPQAKKTLELALREAIRLSDRHIGSEHVLLALLHPGHTAARLLADHGVTLAATRLVVEQRPDRWAG